MAPLTWDRVTLRPEQSAAETEAVAPLIISASRSTDIPAFYADWFMHRLEKGYCAWRSPFNQKVQYISFSRTRVVVFWSKNPEKLMPYLGALDDRGLHYYFQFTLNDYEKEGLEPGVPLLARRLDVFKRLSERVGRERVIWRFDPLIVLPGVPMEHLLEKVRRLGDQLADYTNKLVFSFVDIAAYRKVRGNMQRRSSLFSKDKLGAAEFDQAQKESFARELGSMGVRWRQQNSAFSLATCAEEIDLSACNIEQNRCIDDELLRRLFGQDQALMRFLGEEEGSPLLFPGGTTGRRLKDKGQRKSCGCIMSKDIGEYNTCPHLCIYCYANDSEEKVRLKAGSHDSRAESIARGAL